MTDRIRVWTIDTDIAPDTAESYERLLDEGEFAHAADFLRDRTGTATWSRTARAG